MEYLTRWRMLLSSRRIGSRWTFGDRKMLDGLRYADAATYTRGERGDGAAYGDVFGDPLSRL